MSSSHSENEEKPQAGQSKDASPAVETSAGSKREAFHTWAARKALTNPYVAHLKWGDLSLSIKAGVAELIGVVFLVYVGCGMGGNNWVVVALCVVACLPLAAMCSGSVAPPSPPSSSQVRPSSSLVPQPSKTSSTTICTTLMCLTLNPVTLPPLPSPTCCLVICSPWQNLPLCFPSPLRWHLAMLWLQLYSW